MRRLHNQQTDAGLTLVELLVAMAITAIITATVGSAMIVGLKTSEATGTRLNESHDAQLLSTYVIADLQSVGEGGTTTTFGSSAAACPASEAGYTTPSNLVRLTWTEARPATVNYTAEYRRAYETATQQWVLLRKTCSSSGDSDMRVVVHQLHPTTLPSVDVSQPPNLTLTVTEPSLYVYSVAGVRRTPDASPLPPQPWACTVLSALGTPDPATRSTVAPGPLSQDEDIVVQTGGACSALKITLKPNDTTSVVLDLTESPPGSGRYPRTIPKNAYTWTDGDKLFPITTGSMTLATLRLTVKQACIASSLLAAPATARRVEGAAPSALTTDLVLTATTSGVCLPLEVAFDPRTGTTSTKVLTESTPGNWSGTVPMGAEPWSDGPHVLRLRETGVPTTLATTTFSVTPSCVISPGTTSATPNPVGRTGPGKAQLDSDVQVALTTTGACTGLKLVFLPGSIADGEATAAMTQGLPGEWTGTVTATVGTWTSGTKQLKVRDQYDNDLGTIQMVVSN